MLKKLKDPVERGYKFIKNKLYNPLLVNRFKV